MAGGGNPNGRPLGLSKAEIAKIVEGRFPECMDLVPGRRESRLVEGVMAAHKELDFTRLQSRGR